MSTDSPKGYRERLWPSPWLMIALLLLIPATIMTVTPIASAIAVPVAIAVYVLIAGSLMLMAPVLDVSAGRLKAGSAEVPVSALGEIALLDDAALRRTIGPGADARAYLMVRGYIHRGLRVEIVDDQDPTPYWVLTTRRPQALAAALEAAKEAR